VNALRSLSVRLLLLTVIVVLATEGLVFLPGLAQERRGWLYEHLRDADIAVLAMTGAQGGGIDPITRDALLRLSDAEAIRLQNPTGEVFALSTPNPPTAESSVDLRKETHLQGLGRALAALVRRGAPHVMIIGMSPRQPYKLVEVIVSGDRLSSVLRHFARTNIVEWLLIAGVTGTLLYVALLILLVRPLRRMTGNIVAFRAAPERSPVPDLPLPKRSGDEIAIAARELAAMQAELRTALWRNARLAALGTAVAKVSHDLRGILSSAMLAADRLSGHTDPTVRRSADIVMRAVEQATALVRQTLEFAREGPPPLSISRHKLHEIVAEAAESVPSLRVENQVDSDLLADADRVALFRVLSNLIRNAEQAGATQLTVSSSHDGHSLVMLVSDNGPGLPEAVEAKLFRAFSGGTQGTGLGLAIVRDLMRAHGGDVMLDKTGPDGTKFRLLLPMTEAAEAK
jgi:signal transduction histidine kinase